MRYSLVFAFVLVAFSASAEEKQTAASLSFELPKAKANAWDMKSTLKCTSLARVGLRQNADVDKRDKLIADAGAGTDKLELTLVGRVLLVRVGEHGTDRYKLVGNTKGYLSAVFIGELVPVVNSIVVNKNRSLAVWSINEPADVFTDVPYAEATYLACK